MSTKTKTFRCTALHPASDAFNVYHMSVSLGLCIRQWRANNSASPSGAPTRPLQSQRQHLAADVAKQEEAAGQTSEQEEVAGTSAPAPPRLRERRLQGTLSAQAAAEILEARRKNAYLHCKYNAAEGLLSRPWPVSARLQGPLLKNAAAKLQVPYGHGELQSCASLIWSNLNF